MNVRHRTPSRYIIAQLAGDQVISACAIDSLGFASLCKSDGIEQMTITGRVVAVHEVELVQIRSLQSTLPIKTTSNGTWVDGAEELQLPFEEQPIDTEPDYYGD